MRSIDFLAAGVTWKWTLLLFHTFVGPAYLLCFPYFPVSPVWLAVTFLDDHYFCPIDFYTETEKIQGGRCVICFQDTSQAVHFPPLLAHMCPCFLPSFVPHIPSHVLQRKEHTQFCVSDTKLLPSAQGQSAEASQCTSKHSSE